MVSDNITTVFVPKYAGRWRMSDNICLQATRKPHLLARIMMRVFFDWRWEDLS